MGFKQSFVSIALVQLAATTVLTAASDAYATVNPCHDCCETAAPEYVTVTAQHQAYATCHPAEETHVIIRSKKNYALTSTSIVEVAECTPTVWVSTTVPVYEDWKSSSTVATYIEQPITFNKYHWTETYSTTVTYAAPAYTTPAGSYGYGSNATAPAYPATTPAPSYSTHYSYKTISVENWAEYKSLGPIAIPHYEGSGLCTDCGADSYGAYTQHLTVGYCADAACTTYPEIWIARPQTYTNEAEPYTVTHTDTYCETATPTAAIPGYYNSWGGSYPTGYPAQEDCVDEYGHTTYVVPSYTAPYDPECTDTNDPAYYSKTLSAPYYSNGGNGNGGTTYTTYTTTATTSNSMGGTPNPSNSMGGDENSSMNNLQARATAAPVFRNGRVSKRAGFMVAA